jgi:hypothetical protein
MKMFSPCRVGFGALAILLMIASSPGLAAEVTAVSAEPTAEVAAPRAANIQLAEASNPDESDRLKITETAYSLTLIFVQNMLGKNAYTTHIPVTITNSQGTKILETRVQGPYLLIKLPAGTYKIHATLHGVEQTHQATTGGAGKSARVVFDWD